MLDYGLYQVYKTMGMAGTSYDVQESDDHFVITMGVPGLIRDDIEVLIKNGRRMTIRSKKSSKFTADFSYVFAIPCAVEKEETNATVKNGVLTVFIKKSESMDYKIELK